MSISDPNLQTIPTAFDSALSDVLVRDCSTLTPLLPGFPEGGFRGFSGVNRGFRDRGVGECSRRRSKSEVDLKKRTLQESRRLGIMPMCAWPPLRPNIVACYGKFERRNSNVKLRQLK
eukprot:1345353-Amorphochlora_amoeboformis.AAC.1